MRAPSSSPATAAPRWADATCSARFGRRTLRRVLLELRQVIADLERRRRLWERQPADLRPREDVDVGRDRRGLVERAGAHEPHLGPRVLAEDRDLAGRAPVDPLRAAVVTRHVDRLRRAREQLDAVGLDQQVDDEGASGLPLAVQAVTAMREERIGCHPVTNRSAGASTFTGNAHVLLLETGDGPWTVKRYGVAMDPERARELLAAERTRIERALGRRRH